MQAWRVFVFARRFSVVLYRLMRPALSGASYAVTLRFASRAMRAIMGAVRHCAAGRVAMAIRSMMAVVLGVLVVSCACAAPADSAGHITGVGGVFFKAKDPKALAAWYRDVLGMPVEDWGGAMLAYDAPAHPPALVW